ncbi:MAG: TIM44-like domain-containing protein [Deltaproteobacteria bacterium]|nr:TIM44-like domain-containing protein [Deltaproteobacteria bacterium]
MPALLWTAEALARPGGGDSFSGGGGGGGDGDGFELFFDIAIMLIDLLINYPEIAGPVVVVGIVLGLGFFAATKQGALRFLFGALSLAGAVAGFLWVPNFLYVVIGVLVLVAMMVVLGSFSGKKKPREWSTAAPQQKKGSAKTPASERALFKKITRQDPDFSPVVFADFVYALYAEVQRARGAQKLPMLKPYMSDEVRAAITNAELTSVEDVVIGSMTIVDGTVKDDAATLEIELETSLSEYKRDKTQSYYHRERWRLMRLAGAKSRPPERVSTFHCPNCGAPLDPEQSSVCRMCRETIDTGRFDWRITSIIAQERSEKAPALTGNVAEQGTGEPTVVDARLNEALAELKARDPAFEVEGLFRRVRLVFATFQAAWTKRDLKAMRPFLSDRLFVAQQYWIAAYKRAGLTNVSENARITRFEPARLTSDKYYDAFTLRVFATGLDYTVDASGKVVSGSKKNERAFSEYWTFIRSAEKHGAASDAPTCPNCGAALDINMAGSCTACDAKVSSGRFDWVLSRIEQDEVYRG